MMKGTFVVIRFCIPAFTLAIMLAAGAASAAEYMAGDLRIIDPWARATAGVARNGVAYVTIENMGAVADRLTAVASPVATRAEVHDQVIENGVAKMRAAGPVELPPGARTAIEPGGLHIMLMGLKRPLVEGEQVPLTLVFEKTGRVDLPLEVEAAGATHSGPAGSTN
jgi:periplasmic copper chaperone A